MALKYLPYDYEEVAFPGHPWHHSEVGSTARVVVFLDGEPFNGPVVAASARRGALKTIARNEQGFPIFRTSEMGKGKYKTKLIRGKVEIFLDNGSEEA